MWRAGSSKQITIFFFWALLLFLGTTESAGADAAGQSGFSNRWLLQTFGEQVQTSEEAPVGRFPYIVSLRTVGTFTHFCGGVLVDPSVVITAAHCVDSLSSSKAGVSEPIAVIGAHGINDDESHGAEVISTVGSAIHGQWVPTDFKNGFDIAALILKRPSTRQTIQIAPKDLPVYGQRLLAAGWGGQQGGGFSQTLRQASKLDYIPNENCNLPRVHNGTIKDNMICALDLVSQQDTCHGDSGGPLIIADKNRNPRLDRLVGIVSFGPTPCASGNIPGIYTRVSSFTTWIQSFVNSQSGQPPLPVLTPHTTGSGSQPSTDRYPCPVNTTCDNEKFRIVNGVETRCKCYQWRTNGLCRSDGWKHVSGPGDCEFTVD